MSNSPNIEAFVELWDSGEPPDLKAYVGAAPVSESTLYGLITEDMRRCHDTGIDRTSEYYFKRFKQLNDDQRLDVIYHEFLLREERGEVPKAAEYQQRFPNLADAIARQLALHAALDAVDMPDPTSSLGTLRDFELLEEIGSGGMGKVYRAHHSRLHRDVAVKVLPPDQFRDSAAVGRFEREMQAIGQVMHPNIVQAMDAGEENGRHYLALEFVDGTDAHRLSRTYGELAVPDACEIARQASLGLQHAHALNLVHRDIKPSNLLVSKDGVVKVADMGLALLQQPTNVRSDLTSTGQILGTLDYIAPEQIEDMHEVDARADLYSLGCTLYQLLAGHAPFASAKYSSVLKKLKAHEQVKPQPISTARASGPVPPQLQEIVHQLLAKRTNERIQTAGELAELLERFTVGAQLDQLVTHQQANRQLLGKSDSAPEDDETVVEVTDSAETARDYPSQYPAMPDSTTISSELRRRAKPKTISLRWLALGSVAVVALAAAIFSSQLKGVFTGKGTVIVEAGETALVSIKQGPKDSERVVVEQSKERSFELPAGSDYRVFIEEDEIRFSTEPFRVVAGASTPLDVTQELANIRKRFGRRGSASMAVAEAAPQGHVVYSSDPTAGRLLRTLASVELRAFLRWAEANGLNDSASVVTDSMTLRSRGNIRINSDKGQAGYLIDRFRESEFKIFALQLDGEKSLDEATVAAMEKSEVLALYLRCPVDDAVVARLPTSVQRHLHLPFHEGPTDKTVELLANRVGPVGILTLPDVTNVTPERLAGLADFPLISLTLSAGVTDNHAKEIGRFAGIRQLSVGGESFSDAGLMHLRGLDRLRTVHIVSPLVTKAAAEEFVRLRPKTKVSSPQFGAVVGSEYLAEADQ